MYQLIETGYNVTLNDPITKFCPHFTMDTEETITVRQIISQVSEQTL